MTDDRPQYPPQTQWRARYAALRADNRCATCAGKILPEWPQTSRCPDCTESRKPAVRKYYTSKKGIRTKKKYRSRTEVRERTKATVRSRDMQRKVRGICKDCVQPCMGESSYCAKHHEVHRLSNLDYGRRKRESVRLGIPLVLKPKGPGKRTKPTPILRLRPIKPVFKAQPTPSADPVSDHRDGEISIAEAATRLVELHNGITAQEVGDLLHADAPERNAITNGLKRHAKAGRLSIEGHGMTRVFYPVRHRRAA